jgi:hypothetical protein
MLASRACGKIVRTGYAPPALGECAGVALHALVHPRQLGRGRRLVAAFPFAAGKPWIASRAAALSSGAPASTIQSAGQLRQSGQAHQIDVLRIVAMAQVAHQAAERGGGHGIVDLVERSAPFWAVWGREFVSMAIIPWVLGQHRP